MLLECFSRPSFCSVYSPYFLFILRFSSPRRCFWFGIFALSLSVFCLLPISVLPSSSRSAGSCAKVLESASVASAPSLAGGLQTPWRRSTFQASHRLRSVQSVSCSDLPLIFVRDNSVATCSKGLFILLRRILYPI